MNDSGLPPVMIYEGRVTNWDKMIEWAAINDPGWGEVLQNRIHAQMSELEQLRWLASISLKESDSWRRLAIKLSLEADLGSLNEVVVHLQEMLSRTEKLLGRSEDVLGSIRSIVMGREAKDKSDDALLEKIKEVAASIGRANELIAAFERAKTKGLVFEKEPVQVVPPVKKEEKLPKVPKPKRPTGENLFERHGEEIYRLFIEGKSLEDLALLYESGEPQIRIALQMQQNHLADVWLLKDQWKDAYETLGENTARRLTRSGVTSIERLTELAEKSFVTADDGGCIVFSDGAGEQTRLGYVPIDVWLRVIAPYLRSIGVNLRGP